MEKAKLEQFRTQLERRAGELRRSLANFAEQGRSNTPDSAVDVADQAQQSYTKEFMFTQTSNDRGLLSLVDGALERLRLGSYGECVSCGNEIGMKRLEAVPWTRHCIECQEKAERGQLDEVEA